MSTLFEQTFDQISKFSPEERNAVATYIQDHLDAILDETRKQTHLKEDKTSWCDAIDRVAGIWKNRSDIPDPRELRKMWERDLWHN